MSIRNYFKKLGKRCAGTWGRVNHKRDMRAESKGIRKNRTDMEDLDIQIDCESPASFEDLIELQDIMNAQDIQDIDDPSTFH